MPTEELTVEIRLPNPGTFNSAQELADIQMENRPTGDYDWSHERLAIIMTPTDANKFKGTLNKAGLFYQEVQV